MNSASYEYRNMSARRGHNLCPLECRLSVEKTFPKDHENVVDLKLLHVYDVIFSVLVFRSECFLTK